MGDVVNLYNTLCDYMADEDHPTIGNADGFVEKGGRILMQLPIDPESKKQTDR